MHDQPANRDVDDEISLLELWDMLIRGKYWILGCLAASLMLGGAYLAFKAPVYEASVKVRIGQVAAGGPFEAPDVLSSRLLAEHGEDIADGVKPEFDTTK